MDSTNHNVEITLRIPGAWEHPGKLVERLPEGVQMAPPNLVLADGLEFEFSPLAPDGEFAGVFESSCRNPATPDELEIVANYNVNICITGPGGSMEAAHNMMRAADAIVHAGAAGVFIDNSLLAHGGEFWTEMTEDGSPDAISFAFAGIIGGKLEVKTIGMHVMGFPDIVMKSADLDEQGDTIVDVIRYICNEVKPIGDGHVLCDLDGPRFRAAATDPDPHLPPSGPLHNPFGRLRLTSFKDEAETN